MIGTVFYNIVFRPLEMIMEIVFSFVYRFGNHTVLALLGVSLAVGFLTLPLYKSADKIQKEEREKQKSMEYWVDHIKRTFKGDERYFMLTTYYRQQDYHPIYALRSSISLLLQIPFFVAAYNYLSNLQVLRTSSFWIINSLGSPDQLLSIGEWKINVLPIIMTLINLVSAFIYTKDLKLKDKVQPLLLAGVFLVLLYNSPAGLVLYWIFNQCFSVGKNIVFSFKKKEEDKIRRNKSEWVQILIPEVGLFFLLGLVIPLSAIVSSPLEFTGRFVGPFDLLIYTASVYFGLFLIWFNVFIIFIDRKYEKICRWTITSFFIIAVVDYFIFSKKLGVMSDHFVFDTTPVYYITEKIINLLVIFLLIWGLYYILKKNSNVFSAIVGIVVVGLVCISVVNICEVNKTILEAEAINNNLEEKTIFNLSKNKKNVVIIVLDRAIGPLVPYIFNDNMYLSEQYKGFTYYQNTMSYGMYTNYAMPPVLGGYEYTPENVNIRGDELLKDKHNEAMSVLPILFANNGASVTMCDIPYINYHGNGDLSIYDNIPNVTAFNTKGNYGIEEIDKYTPFIQRNKNKNAQYYSLFRSSPLAVQSCVYNEGKYFNEDTGAYKDITENFLNWFLVLTRLVKHTSFDNEKPTLTVLYNGTTHEPVLLETPDYLPGEDTDYIGNKKERFYPLEHKIKMKRNKQLAHYDVDAAALIQIGKWLDYLKSNNAYDNTRIIIVSDHGYYAKNFKELIVDDELDAEGLAPILLVKDFYSNGDFNTSDMFMTNADVPTMALEGIISNPINPYTGKLISSKSKNDKKQYATGGRKYQLRYQKGNVHNTSDGNWYWIHDSIWDKSNYECVGEEIPKDE